ncbi:MAG: DUF2079 domain-containing protein [Deltaproteobacteria bacterium]|nr:DUF2079 domain-containing protein [Deltaproteobacteria bacterium]
MSAVLYAALALARYLSFHQQTFDLAMYSRMAWGLAHGNLWDPILSANDLGLHLSPVLLPFGLVGRLVDPAVVLLVGQALFVALAAWPLARIGARRLGTAGAILGAVSLLLYPNLLHVATYEAHPGTLALLPLAWSLDAADRGDARAFAFACLGVMCCREDLAMPLALLAIVTPWQSASKRRLAWSAGALAMALFGFFLLVLAPRFAPAHGSLSAHFGRWGESPAQVIVAWITHPMELAQHLMVSRRLSYLPRLLWPLAFLPLLSPRWLVPALPVLAINLLSDFPTTTQLDSHYLSTALPFLIVAALDGLVRVQRRAPERRLWPLLGLPLLLSHILLGGSPVSLDFDASRFRRDADSQDGTRILGAIPTDASVQAPDALLAHLSARPLLFRSADPDHGARFIVLDVRYRRRYAHQESLLRTLEEPRVRAWLAKPQVALRVATPAYLLLERGVDPRSGVGFARALVNGPTAEGQRITACLSVSSARAQGRLLTLDWRVLEACPADLAVRVDVHEPPIRVDLLADGLLSPSQLRRGDHLRTRHRFERPLPTYVYVGALRQSGARPRPEDPAYVRVPVAQGSVSEP